MTEGNYDEDLERNPFFESLRTKAPNLFTEALDRKLYILVPKRDSLKGSLKKEDKTEMYKRHILRLEETNEGEINYYTLENELISTSSDGQILTLHGSNVGNGCQPINVRVLFEETYFTENGASCKLLCISRPLIASSTENSEASRSNFIYDFGAPTSAVSSTQLFPDSLFFASSSTADPFNYYHRILFGSDHEHKLQAQLKKNLSRFVDRMTIEYQSAWHFEQLKIFVREEFYATLKDVFGRKRLSAERLSDNDITQLRISTEIYFYRCIHSRLLSLLCACVRDEESSMNRFKYAASELAPSDWGILPQLYGDLSLARKQLSKLNELDTPYGKLLCLRRTMESLTASSRQSNEPRVPLSTDDIIPPLAFLIAKSNVFNWVTNLVYISDFHFSSFANDELGYCLASFEAAVQFVRDGSMKPTVLARWRDWALGKSLDGGQPESDYASGVIMKTDDTIDLAAMVYWECMIDVLQTGDDTALHGFIRAKAGISDPSSSEVTKVDAMGQDEVSKEQCHPLCECEQCRTRRNERIDPCVNAVTAQGFTALHFATLFGQTSMLHYLIRLGGDVEKMDEHGRTALHWACRVGSQSCALLLLHHGAQFVSVDSNGNTPLHLATYYGHVDCVKALLYFNQQVRGANSRINSLNRAGESAMQVAVRLNHVEIVSVLLECGANAIVRGQDGKPAMDFCDNFEIHRLLTLASVVVSPHQCKQPTLPTPTAVARDNGAPVADADGLDQPFSATPSALIDLNIENIDKLLKAVADDDLPLVQYYLGPTDGVEVRGFSDRCHPLCQCPECQDLDDGQVNEKLSVNATGTNGLNALHTAALFGRLQLVTYLLHSCGADVNWPSAADGRTSLHFASMTENVPLIELLVKNGADISVKDSAGDTPLHVAIAAGSLDASLYFFEKFRDQNHVLNSSGDNLLHKAVKENQLEIAKMLLENGADPDARNGRDLTPMECAVSNEMRQLLIQKRAAA